MQDIRDQHHQSFDLGDVVCWSASTKGSSLHTGIVVGFTKTYRPIIEPALQWYGTDPIDPLKRTRVIPRTPHITNITKAQRAMKANGEHFNKP